MSKPTRWQCTHCGANQHTPLESECPKCGVTGKRYPKDTRPAPIQLGSNYESAEVIRRERNERQS